MLSHLKKMIKEEMNNLKESNMSIRSHADYVRDAVIYQTYNNVLLMMEKMNENYAEIMDDFT